MAKENAQRTNFHGKLISEFVSDIEPIFRGRNVIYADIGAYDGGTFEAIFDSRLRINRACLIEANPKKFEQLEKSISNLDANGKVNCINVAIANVPGTVLLQELDDCSRVVGEDEGSSEGVFEVEAKTLDSLRPMFPDGHISILKIDVEGSEKNVLLGAEQLLADRAVEIIYVEAGMNPNSTGQTHYREIEDELNKFGYRLFKIYEQTMEWIDDRPLLRRVNLAFVSPTIVEKYPLSLLRDLDRQDREIVSLRNKIDALENQLSERTNDVAILTKALNQSEVSLEKLQFDTSVRIQEKEKRLEETSAKVRQLEKKEEKLTEQMNKAHDELNSFLSSTSWKITSPLRGIVRGLRIR